jgi:ABC-2 type transport system permease protein
VTIGQVTLPAATLARMAFVMSFGVLPACAVGLFMRAYAPASSAAAFANIAYLGMAFLSGLFFPLSGVLHDIRAMWPTYTWRSWPAPWAACHTKARRGSTPLALAAMTAGLVALAARRVARRG